MPPKRHKTCMSVAKLIAPRSGMIDRLPRLFLYDRLTTFTELIDLAHKHNYAFVLTKIVPKILKIFCSFGTSRSSCFPWR
jgi:hypothetical protein